MEIRVMNPDVKARITFLPKNRLRLTIEYPAHSWQSAAIFEGFRILVEAAPVPGSKDDASPDPTQN